MSQREPMTQPIEDEAERLAQKIVDGFNVNGWVTLSARLLPLLREFERAAERRGMERAARIADAVWLPDKSGSVVGDAIRRALVEAER